MATDDVFAWAAALPTEHTCEWVSHPTQDEIRERDERIVWKRLWYCPFIKVQRIEHCHGNFGFIQPYEECAICDAHKGAQTDYSHIDGAITFGQEYAFDGARWNRRSAPGPLPRYNGQQIGINPAELEAGPCHDDEPQRPTLSRGIDPWFPPDANNLADACVFE
jgi:hypothetical protein